MVSVLVETASGYALLKLKKDSLVHASPAEIAEKFETAKGAKKCVELSTFKRFSDVREATSEISAIVDGKIGDVLKSLLKKKVVKAGIANQGLAVWDKTLAQAIKQKFDIEVLLSPAVHEIFRGVKAHIEDLVADLGKGETKVMSMSLSHSLNRFKLKFSPEKVDVMVIQAVGLLDDLDKELNNLAMRLKEWYGFHFPELLKLVSDNATFAKLVKLVGYRTNVQTIASFDGLTTEDVEAQIRQAAETSMGSDLVDVDLSNIMELADRVLELTEYREKLTAYLRMRMMAIAPNLTHMVGELLGARLLAQAGSLMGLAKQASSTVQILGAEKALFRALKSKANTPKYGLIYHAHLVGQANAKLKGKISRILAAKLSLCTRVDALKEVAEPTVAIGAKAYVERRLEELTEQQAGGTISHSAGKAVPDMPKYVPSRLREEGVKAYNPANDFVKAEVKAEPEEASSKKSAVAESSGSGPAKKAKKEKKDDGKEKKKDEDGGKEKKKEEKEKKKKKRVAEEEGGPKEKKKHKKST